MVKAPTPLRVFRLAQEPRMSLKVLAEKVGVTEGHLSRVEREGTASFALAIKLAEETALPLEAFAPRSNAA